MLDNKAPYAAYASDGRAELGKLPAFYDSNRGMAGHGHERQRRVGACAVG